MSNDRNMGPAWESLNACLAFDVRDWAQNKTDAWLWGIIVGWGDEAMKEVAAKHAWSDDAVARLRSLRRDFEKRMTTGDA